VQAPELNRRPPQADGGVPAPLGQMRERRAGGLRLVLEYVERVRPRSLTKQMVRRRRRTH